MAVSYILIRPPQLPELGDPSDAFIVGYDPTTDKTVKIKVANIGGGSVSPPLDISWKSNIEYSSGEIVEYGLRLWKSLQGSNEGNFPTEGIWWTEVARGNQSITYWTAGVYTKDPTIKLVNDIFYRLDAALPFESVNFVNELANGDWVAIGGGGGHTILDPAENTMPTQPALQFGAGFTVTDEVGKTVVERDIIDFGDITPDPTKGKKIAKVKDDGTGLDYTDYGYDEVVQKAQTFNEGTLKKFDANGNDVDSGLTGESLDIYAVSPSLINALTNESNWRDGGGNPIVGEVAFASGVKGQRYYSDEFFYECIADNSWVRTYTGRPVINIYDNPALTFVFKGYLEDTLNWVGKIYVGPAITGVAQGTRHYDNDYVYEFFQTNVPIRYSRD